MIILPFLFERAEVLGLPYTISSFAVWKSVINTLT